MMLFFALYGMAKDRNHNTPYPDHFEIGRRTFFDFGPPFNYYNLYIVRPAGMGSTVERISLTPGGGSCMVPPKTEVSNAVLHESISELLENKNPCSIPEKELKKEQKRCKKCLVFSGAEVVMQVQCGDSIRLIHSSVFDRDWFDPNSRTPDQTSWTMRLLRSLDKASGPTEMEKPIFPGSGPVEESNSTTHISTSVRDDLAAGLYDPLFGSASQKASEIYRESQTAPPPPSIKIDSVVPYGPDNVILPSYPPIARAANIGGNVALVLSVDQTGHVSDVKVESGHPMLKEAAKQAVMKWRFPVAEKSQDVRATIKFEPNCR
jgi:TonB family protein